MKDSQNHSRRGRAGLYQILIIYLFQIGQNLFDFLSVGPVTATYNQTLGVHHMDGVRESTVQSMNASVDVIHP